MSTRSHFSIRKYKYIQIEKISSFRINKTLLYCVRIQAKLPKTPACIQSNSIEQAEKKRSFALVSQKMGMGRYVLDKVSISYGIIGKVKDNTIRHLHVLLIPRVFHFIWTT